MEKIDTATVVSSADRTSYGEAVSSNARVRSAQQIGRLALWEEVNIPDRSHLISLHTP